MFEKESHGREEAVPAETEEKCDICHEPIVRGERWAIDAIKRWRFDFKDDYGDEPYYLLFTTRKWRLGDIKVLVCVDCARDKKIW